MVLFADVWLFVLLIKLRRMSKLFLASSKRENFEGGSILVRKVKSVFLAAMFVDFATAFFSIGRAGYQFGFWDMLPFIVQLVCAAGHFGFGIPVYLLGEKARRLYMHLYPAVPKVGVYKRSDFDSTSKGGEDSFFEVAQMQQRAPDASLNILPEKISEQKDMGEIIEYNDEGYIGAWQLEKSEAEEKNGEQEQTPMRECPFCGTLNGINNQVCDFCGADIPNSKD